MENTFKHGIHPPDRKHFSQHKEIERIPFSDTLILPLSQHIGKPSLPVVRKGQAVKKGERIAEPSGFLSVALHSPVDGVVHDIGLYEGPKGLMQNAIVIKPDAFSPQEFTMGKPVDPNRLSHDEFIEYVQNGGIVGLGGAAFPAHVKFHVPPNKSCEYLMLNGCECEPYLTSDDRLMIEEPEKILDGLLILGKFLKVEKLFIAVEDNKPEAIQSLQKVVDDKNCPVTVIGLKTKYPQGAEKMMITAILGKEVPSGKLPIDLGVMVSNVGTSVALSDLFRKGMPLIERIVTVTGEALSRPANLRVPIGTPMQDVLEYCGGEEEKISHVILGGPMMGAVQKSINNPVVKGTSGVLVKAREDLFTQEAFNCIRCGRCVEACPLFLNPALLGIMAKKQLWEEMQDHNLMDCFECGSCTYVCPSGINLVQSFRVAKGFVRQKIAAGT